MINYNRCRAFICAIITPLISRWHVAANLLAWINGITDRGWCFTKQPAGTPGVGCVRRCGTIENITEQAAVPRNLQLVLTSARRDKMLDNATNMESGAAALTKIDTGEILSMASYPDFNLCISAIAPSSMIFEIALS